MKLSDTPKLRGYFGAKYATKPCMHNHENGKFLYKYPLIQYKVIYGTPTIVGIGSGSDVLLDVGMHEDEFTIDGVKYDASSAKIRTEHINLGVGNKIYNYEFITPWIALNHDNTIKYNNTDEIEKEEILERILIGNLIALSKGVNHDVEDTIKVRLDVENINISLKGIDMYGFVGGFKSNFELPDYIGLGRSVSRGFGAITRYE
jgi:hypothetical protein